MKFLRIICALLASLGGLSLPAQAAAPVSSIQPVSSVPASRLARLRRGINASGWFAQVYDKRGYTKEHFQSWTTAQDIALMKSRGLDHGRLSVNPTPLLRDHRP